MRKKSFGKSANRSVKGSAITEFGPALFVLLLIFFFPMLDMFMLALTYADCYYLNFLLLRQAALERVLVLDQNGNMTTDLTCSTDPNGSLNKVIQVWQQSGLGKFASNGTTPTQKAAVDLTEGSAKVKYIHVTLDATCRPFVYVPFFAQVPGLNAPLKFQFTGRSVIEYVPS